MKKTAQIKNTQGMTAFLAAIAITALVSSPALGAELKTSSIIPGDTVTVGDVFSDAGELSDRYLAPAPAAGGSLILNKSDLIRISDAFHLGWQPTTQEDRLVIRRESTSIDSYTIESALQDKISAQMDGRKFDMTLGDKKTSLQLPSGAEKTVQVDKIKIDLQKGTFLALLSAPAGVQNPLVKKEIAGRIFALEQVPVLKNPLRSGDIIDARDIDYVDMRATDVTANMVVNADKLIGQTPRRGIPAMRPVRSADIEAPAIVKKGDLVTVILRNDTLNLTIQGRALQSGGAGDLVRIVNTASNRLLEAVVTGPQSVTIRTASSTL
jgi:flagella basal body P-ring formation protein FlgA